MSETGHILTSEGLVPWFSTRRRAKLGMAKSTENPWLVDGQGGRAFGTGISVYYAVR